MNVCSIWPFAQISDDFYYVDICQCARYFVAALFKELALINIREMWGLESRLLWQSLGLVSKFEPGLGGNGLLYYITVYLYLDFKFLELFGLLLDLDWVLKN